MRFFSQIRVLFLLLLLLVFGVSYSFAGTDVFTILSPNYFNEQGNVYNDIHYLKNEFLSVEFCTNTNSKNISLDVISQNNTIVKKLDLYVVKGGGNKGNICYYSNYNLDELNLSFFTLDLTYTNSNKIKKITRTFRRQKQYFLINHVLNNNIENLTPLDLSYFLLVNNDIESIHSKKSIEAYSLLKSERNNQEKCWPAKMCSVSETSEILRNLKMAGYDMFSRILEDGNTYMNNNILTNKKTPFKFNITMEEPLTTNETLNCNLLVDGTDSYYYQFNSADNLTVSNYATSSIKFHCDKKLQQFYFKLFFPSGGVKDSISKLNYNDTFYYTIGKFACIGESSKCNFSDSISGLYVYSNKLNDYDLINDYVDSFIVKNNSEKYLKIANEYENTGKYLFYKPDSDLLSRIKFKQNNDGSWGTGSNKDKILETAWAVLGIQKASHNSEYVSDGKKWIYYNEPTEGWGSIEKNALAYLAIKEQIKPYLKITVRNKIENKTSFTISNPTIYELKNVELSFDNNINKYLSYTQDLGDLNGDKSINFSVVLRKNFYGSITGNLFISGVDAKNTKLNLIKMPITIVGKEPIKYSSRDYFVSNDFKNINLNFSVDDGISSKCSLINPFDGKKMIVNISTKNSRILLNDTEMKEGNFSTVLSCLFGEEKFEIPIKFRVNISKPSFTFLKSVVNITGKDNFSVEINSLLNHKQIISISVNGPLMGIIVPSEKEKIIAGGDTRDLFFEIHNQNGLNLSSLSSGSYILVTSDTGYSKRIPIQIIPDVAGNSSGSHWFLYLIIIVVILVVVLFLIRRYRNGVEDNDVTTNQNEGNDDEIYIDDY